MPRFVRPFWLSARADGRASAVELGPRSLDGGINATILLRERGGISDAKLCIVGSVRDGWASVRAYIDDPNSPDHGRELILSKPI